ncbi:NAD(P)H-dependent oxidoreductase [Gallaecimonas sp. GXIMD4217]|uniref:NAD(P)H-dependent oxidoreductase n=1 Tax=Gallaecimonas sp. GXIMD4217 TaxID=3131927 RepID=UPI00311AE0F3
MKNVLLLSGNPKPQSFVQRLCDQYQAGAEAHANIRRFNLAEMAFNPSLDSGYDAIQALEPCLASFQEALAWADHLVIMAPVWWGGLPAKLKGIFERTFLPNVTFKYEEGELEPRQLLKGKTARIVLTMDTPADYTEDQARPVIEQLDRFTLQFCGVGAAKVSLFGSVLLADETQRAGWLQEVRALAAECR